MEHYTVTLTMVLAIMLSLPLSARETEQTCKTPFEKLDSMQKAFVTTAMGTVNAYMGTPFQHAKNALQNKEAIPPLKHLWRGTGLNIIRSTPSTLPEALVMGNADRIITYAQLPVSCETQKAGLAFSCAAPGTLLNTVAEQLVMRKKNNTSCYTITKNIIQEGGIKGLLRGFWPKLLRDGTGSLAYWYGAPMLKNEFKKQNMHDSLATVAAGVSVAIPSTIATHPFDTISTVMQNDLRKKTYRSTLQSFAAYIRTHGVKELFKGITPRVISASVRIPALLGIQNYLTDYFSASKHGEPIQ